MIKLELVIKSLSGAKVEYVIVGNLAARSYSSIPVTYVIELCYSRSTENLNRIVNALAPYNPRPRNFPAELPFIFDKSTLRNATNFTFETAIGDIDLLGEVAGIGDFQAVSADSENVSLHGFEVKILTIDGLIKAKRAAGRTKDLLVLPELEALREALSDEIE